MGRRQRLEQTSAGTGRAALKPSQRASEPGGKGERNTRSEDTWTRRPSKQGARDSSCKQILVCQG